VHLALAEQDHPWVSRGALKLIAALDHFGIDPGGLLCLDLGASTGGFSQVLLDRGADRVVAVDVGHGQLHPDVAVDPRVLSLEGINVRGLETSMLPGPPALITADLSFISLRKALPVALDLAPPECRLVALIKPQFEAGRAAIAKGGVVRDPEVHRTICEAITVWLNVRGWQVAGVIDSPIEGGDGNREFLVAARRPSDAHGRGN